MKHSFNEDRSRLIIDVDEAERELLAALSESEIQSDCAMHEFFERLVCNSELKWVDPSQTGDLTDAPILGILGEPEPGAGGVLAGRWPDSAGVTQGWFHPIKERWGYEPYQLRSPLVDLRDNGRAVFCNSW